jgi:hypothetical protein
MFDNKMLKLVLISLIFSFNFQVFSQINSKRMPHKSIPKDEFEYVDLDGWPFFSAQYGRRNLNFPSGNVRLAFEDGNGAEIIFEDEILSPTSLAHCFELQVMGAYHNDLWSTKMLKRKFWKNTYLFWSIRVSYFHGNRINSSQGGFYDVELGGDFGLRNNFNKNHYFEIGLKTVPFHMNYIDIKRFNVSEVVENGGHLDLGFNQFSLGSHPFLKWGLYFQTKERLNSIDFICGYHFHWIYGSRKHLFLTTYDDVENVQPEKVFLNNNELKAKDFSLNSWFFNLAWTFYFN